MAGVFTIQLHLSRLSQNKNQCLQAFIRLIQSILISFEKVLEWLKYSRSLHDLREFSDI
jgi:hypothetical protein